MIPGNAVLDAFINANILFVVAYALWLAVRFLLDRAGLKHAYATQLRLLNTIFLAIVFSPFIVLAVTALTRAGLIGNGMSVNLSDIAVSYYLNGGIEMKAAEFQNILLWRDNFTKDVMNLAGLGAMAVVAAFIGGAILGATRLLYSMFCLREIVNASYAWRRFGKLRIHLSDRTLVPFSSRGLRNYYVVIPSHMLGNADELKVSLAHEFQHLRQGDIEWEILLEAFKPFFFLNPAYHAWKRQVEDLRELSCDQEVLTAGKVGVKAYCDTLLSVCQNTLRRDRVFVVAVPKVTLVTADRSYFRDGKVSFLERRIRTLFDARRLRRPKLVYAATTLPLIAVVVLTAVAIQKPADWSQDRLMLSTVVNLERLDEINRINTFGRLRN